LLRLSIGGRIRPIVRAALIGETMIEQDYRPSISFPEPPEFPKLNRAHMAQLVVETEKCPLILSRVLEVIREHEILPFTISTRRESHVQTIEMELSALPNRPATAILQDLRRLSNVRVARFLLPADQAPASTVAAKV
jgi:acetolactate synthase regulatory subunit